MSGSGLIFALLAIGIPMAILIGIAIDARNYLFNSLLRKVSAEIGGTFVRGGPLQPPTIRMPIGRVPALVAFWVGPQRIEPVGMFRALRTPAATGVVEIEHKLWGNRIIGPPRVSIGDQEFEERFRIYATSAPDAVRLLTEGMRRTLEKLAVMGKVRAAFRPKLIEISVAAEDWDTFTARQFVELAVEAARPELGPEAVAANIGDIEWIEDVEPESPTCQVCATALEDSVVRCRRCRTPHHAECWEYSGICATFSCGCRKAVKGRF